MTPSQGEVARSRDTDAVPVASTLTASAALATTSVPTSAPGDDFAIQVRTLHRIGACGSDEAVPDRVPRTAIERHCADMQRRYRSYRRAWATQAQAFIAGLRPADLPATVVYPFGGGDLVSALVVFPDAHEITTLSLEAAGDVRAVDTIAPRQLTSELALVGHDIARLYHAAHSTTKSLQSASHARLPGTIMFALAAMAVHDLEPLSLRYFDIEPDGSLRYLTGAELDARAAAAVAAVPAPRTRTKPGKGTVRRAWREQESVFANIEIGFRKRGDAGGAPRIYRHIVANLDDHHLAVDRRVLAHLDRKGKVAVMTKAASFLLWYDDFSLIRSYLIDHLAWMVSDASGIPPTYAAAAGLEQIPYGKFVGPYFLKDPNQVSRDMIKLWRKGPARPLPFRFGYPDADDNHHLLITRPK